MRIGGRKRVVTALLAVWIGTGGVVSAVLATPRSETGDRPAATTAMSPVSSRTTVAASCLRSISCGAGCYATLSTGFCALAIDWEAKARIGGIQIGPAIKVRCDICECWYTYTSATGNRVFKRTTKFNCSAGSPDVEMYVV
jgi:hypothetical protein